MYHSHISLLLFCLFTVFAAAQGQPTQGTPGGKTPILAGFTPLTEKELQEGVIRLFDGLSTYGWRYEGVKVQEGKLCLSLTPVNNFLFEDTPFALFGSEQSAKKNLIFLDGDFPFPDEISSMKAKLAPPVQSLFDGTTLAGWKLHGKAEAEVKEGVIRLTNGIGSLETEGKYGDFVLQLEYFTPVREGKGINSGVFFRCIPGEIMNGYECQILNKPGENDYKLIGTDTGGLFHRQVGRNVGPKDGEWNYITIAARGKRLATWVNGIQVTDWEDERAPHDNPRNGSRTEAGTIQLQGHDPETEILFRNIRIRELQ